MSTRYNTGNPIESTDVRDMSDNAKNLDLFSNSSELSFDDRFGVERKTIHGMNSEFDAQILNMGFTRVGTFLSGATLTNPRQTLLWDIADGGDGQEYGWSGTFAPHGKIVPPSSSPTSTGGVAIGAWVSRFDPLAKTQIREALRRSYAEAGYNLVAGSFEVGGTLVNANDVLLQEASGKAFSGSAGLVAAGTDPASGGYTAINMEQIRTQLSAAHGGALVRYTPDTVPSLLAIDIEAALRNRRNITDLGAISGVADAAVDARVVASVEAGYVIDLPDAFNYKLSSYGVLFLSTKHGAIICSSGRAKMTASVAGLMIDMPPPFKFEGWHFENIDFVGADKQNPASQFMFAAEGEYAANFTTINCSWDGFHTIYKASLIGTHHYKPDYLGVGDTGAIADTFHWTTSLYSSFNLNEWHAPRMFGKFGRLFQILGGNSNYIYHPWFEKIETFSPEMILLRQMFNFQIIGGWLENFKTQFFINLDGDGTENTQSDMIVIDGLHLNNSWAVNDPHMGQPSGFMALVNRLNPQFPGNMYDTKMSFRNIFEHTQSVPGWALTRTGSTLNQESSFNEYINNRLLAGQPNTSGGMTLGGGNPDIRAYFRDLMSNKLDLAPSAYQIITGRETTGSQKDLVFDNVGDAAYFRRNAAKLIQWSTTFFAPGTNNNKTCGLSTFAWAGGYTQTAFTVLSDESYKSKPLPIDDVLLDAWSEVEFFTYQFLDRIEAKGPDGARWHFGVVAQRVVEAMERHGLDWEKFAFICLDKWDASPATYDADGNLMSEAVEAGEKFGIRYEEALVLEAALQRRNYQQLTARIEALENK